MQVTPHFRAQEFACHDGTAYPAEWIADRLKPLCDALEVIRAECGGKPVSIISGYRSPRYNEARRRKSKGVAKDSRHIQGIAVDIAIAGVTPEVVHAAVLRLVKAGKLDAVGGVGLYREWVHVDMREREDGRLARWTGEGVSVA